MTFTPLSDSINNQINHIQGGINLSNVIKYGLIILAIIGIGLVLRNVVIKSKNNTDWEETKNNQNYYKVTISLLDKNTSDQIEGFTLSIKNDKGQVIERWTTTKESYVVNTIPKGKYTLEQESAPEGYSLNEDVVEFTIKDKDIKLVMYNENSQSSSTNSNNSITNDVNVVDTLSLKNPWLTIGTCISIFGLSLIIFYKRNNIKEQ